MNSVQSLIDRQMGIYCRMNYDSVLQRLLVNSEESFYGLQGSDVVTSFEHDPPIFACRFAEVSGYEHILALANEDGRVAIQDTTSVKSASRMEGFQCHNNAVFDLVWMPGHMNFVTVSGDHTACLWDVGGGGARAAAVFAGHSRSVKSAAFAPAGRALATGGRDGHVLVWDPRAPAHRPDNRLCAGHAAPPSAGGKRPRALAPRAVSVTGLVFQDDVTLISCGECDGNIKVWDLRKNYSAYTREPLPKHSIPYCGSSAKNGYTNLIVDSARVRLYASCMDDVIYCFNVSTYTALPERRYVGHENGTFYIKTALSGDDEYLVSGSTDKHAYVWAVRGAAPVVRLAGHRAEVTCAAWRRGPAPPLLVTAGDDARHKLWRVGPEWASRDEGPLRDEEHRGRAELVPLASLPRLPPWGALDHTPRSRKRSAPAPPTSAGKRPRGAGAGPSSKRCLAELMSGGGGARADDAELPMKRLRLDSVAEESAAPGEPPLGAAGPARAPSPERAPWGLLPGPLGASFLSPTKRYAVTSCRMLSPKRPRLSPPEHRTPEKAPNRTPVKIIRFSPPTRDLPDYVLSGEAPHLRPLSPISVRRREAADWLTRYSREKKAINPLVPSPTPLSPKENLPSRRNSVTEKTPKSSKKSRTLLKYFTVSVKEQKSPHI